MFRSGLAQDPHRASSRVQGCAPLVEGHLFPTTLVVAHPRLAQSETFSFALFVFGEGVRSEKSREAAR